MTAGLLVLVVGPSGAGKDTVLNYAHARLSGNPRFVFPRRVITRPPGPGEDHEPVTEQAFSARRFALAWAAHGLHYGVPERIEADLAAGKIVVVNVSRGVSAEAARKYRCKIVEIAAPATVLAARLAARRREAAGDIAARLARVAPGYQADAIIMNDSTIEAAGEAFLAELMRG